MAIGWGDQFPASYKDFNTPEVREIVIKHCRKIRKGEKDQVKEQNAKKDEQVLKEKYIEQFRKNQKLSCKDPRGYLDSNNGWFKKPKEEDVQALKQICINDYGYNFIGEFGHHDDNK